MRGLERRGKIAMRVRRQVFGFWGAVVTMIVIVGCAAPPQPKPREWVEGHRQAIERNEEILAAIRLRVGRNPASDGDNEALRNASCNAYMSEVALGGTKRLDPCVERTFHVPANGEASFITEARANLVRDFKDPPAAVFRDERISTRSLGMPVLCGEVNGKNSYGAYTGYKRFVATTTPKQLAMEGGLDFFEIWDNHCRRQ